MTVAALNEATNVSLAGRMEFSAGNSAVMRETLTDARDRYVAALRLDPTDAAAKANLELLLSRTGSGQQSTDANDGQSPQDGGPGQQQPPPNAQPGDAPQQPGQAGDQPGGRQPGTNARPGQPGQPGQPGSDGDGYGVPDEATTFAEAQAALEAALSALGSEVSREQALRILELARQANSLDRLPRAAPQDGGPPPPR